MMSNTLNIYGPRGTERLGESYNRQDEEVVDPFNSVICYKVHDVN